MIRAARVDELRSLQTIEEAAGQAFRDIGMSSVADHDPPSLEELLTYQRAERAWVATDEQDAPVGYLLVDIVGDAAHIEQVSVHPGFSRRRLGAALLDMVNMWARERSLHRLTLTTFAEVPWNAPYYRRLGFTELPAPDWTDDIRQIVRREADLGLDAWPRVVMARPVASWTVSRSGRSEPRERPHP